MTQIPTPRVPDPLRAIPVALDERHQQLDRRGGGELSPDECATTPAVVLEHRPQLVAPAQRQDVADLPQAGSCRLDVANPGRRRHDDSRSDHLGPPAQVHVLAEESHLRIESAERTKQVGTHQHAPTRHSEDFPDLVVLSLVELTGLHSLDGRTETVDAEADLEQAVGCVPFDEFRADDARVGAVGLLDHPAHGVGSGSDVVVADQEVRRPLDSGQRLVRRRREPPVLHLAAHEGAWEHGCDTRRQLLVAASTTSTSRFG